MSNTVSDFEVCFQGRKFLTVNGGRLDVSGADFQSDLANISKLMGILSDVLNTALTSNSPAPPVPQVEAAPAQTGNVYHFHKARRV